MTQSPLGHIPSTTGQNEELGVLSKGWAGMTNVLRDPPEASACPSPQRSQGGLLGLWTFRGTAGGGSGRGVERCCYFMPQCPRNDSFLALGPYASLRRIGGLKTKF